jgi:ABC-type transport system involved in multi-copper enzyme maturation permease subunit
MSAPTTVLDTPIVARRVPVAPVSRTSAIRSEWVKLTTLRSTWLTLGFAFLGMIAVGAIAGGATNAQWADMHPGELAHFNAVDTSLLGVNLAQLAIGVLGVLVVTGEYSTGMIRSSLAAVPRRTPVLTAKLAVFSLATLISMTVASFAAFFLGQALLGTHGTTIGSTGAFRAVVGVALFLTTVAVIAVALGFIVRSTAGGIAGVVALFLVIPVIGNILPQTWQDHLLPYLPSNAGLSLYSVAPDLGGALSPSAAFLDLVVWAAVAVAIALRVLRRRDA